MSLNFLLSYLINLLKERGKGRNRDLITFTDTEENSQT